MNLEIKNLTVDYGDIEVLKDINLYNLKSSTTTMLLGANGSGKSSFMRAIAGFNKAKGEIIFNKQNLLNIDKYQRSSFISYMPQNLPTGKLTVLETLLVANKINKEIDNYDNEIVCLAMLSKIGIENLSDKQLNELSGGQQQLVALAISLIRQPKILLLDEPLSALDLNYQIHCLKIIKEQTKVNNLITIISIHDLNLALKFADSCILLANKTILQAGEVLDVITEKNIQIAYKVKSRIEKCSQNKEILIVDDVESV